MTSGYAGDSVSDATRDFEAAAARGDSGIASQIAGNNEASTKQAAVFYNGRSKWGAIGTACACYGCGAVVGGAISGYTIGNDIRNGFYGSKANPDLTSGPLFNENVEEEKDLDFDKVRDQLGPRGWTEDLVKELVNGPPAGTSVDQRGPKNTKDGLGRNDPATVWGPQMESTWW